ncbi:GyrI-like domain-containing protein [Clostridium sp. 'deep sea']|uniref:GyrI-like domain-containing protein n=1 Tax=Clostridium sp. 'deep sea' TaxID=2779445 RepID=UPI00325FA99F
MADKSKHVEGELNKDNLAYTIMIRQPEFVTNHFFNEIIEAVKNKKPHELLNRVKFQVIKEGKCVQMLHVGSYDNEPASFNKIHNYCKENNLTRLSKKHREIYISDFRKTEPNKLKTVLRIKVK